MPDRRWRKVARDAWLHRSRTLLVVLAIAVGLSGAGTILNAWAIVERATREEFRVSNPPAATLRTDSIDDALLQRVREVPGVADAQARRRVVGAVQVQGSWRTAMLFAVRDFTDVRIGRIAAGSGAWPPADGTIVVERSSAEFSGAAVGQPMTVAVGDRETVSLPVTGIARDVGLAPGWMEHLVYGFVTPATLDRLGAPSTMNELQLTVTDPSPTQARVRVIAYEVKGMLERAGRPVLDVDVPVPGEHVHAAQMDSLLLTQGAFAVLALVVCSFLVVNLVSAMLAGQVREIGIMKAIGADSPHLVRMYIAFAAALGLLASIVAIPVALVAGRQYAALRGELLNFDVTPYAVPGWVVALQLVVGVLLPVLAASVPVFRACRITVAAALRDVGIEHDGAESAFGARSLPGLTRPTLLALRSALRRRQRMVLTLLALATGGAVFLGAGNLRASVIGSLDVLYGSQRYHFSVRLDERHRADSVEAMLAQVPGVRAAEGWGSAGAAVVQADGHPGRSFALVAPPASSNLIDLDVTAGRRIQPGDSNAVVVSASLQKQEPGLRVGREIGMQIDGHTSNWIVVGVAESGPIANAFVSREALAAATGVEGVASVMVAARSSSAASHVGLIQRVRSELGAAGVQVASSQLLAETRRVLEDHLLMVVQFLGVMGWVMILVGGMGLGSTIGLSVLERTREIGILRALGARHGSIFSMIQTEGLLIALASWLIALPLSLPMSAALGEAFGRVMMKVPIAWLPNGASVWSWLALVVVVSGLACTIPALHAMRITIASAVAYE